MNFDSVIQFWFKELEPKLWFAKDTALDQEITKRFSDLHKQATRGELFSWRAQPQGRLAEIILLDQFSRNIFRGRPESFAFDPLALILAQEAIHSKADLELTKQERVFVYMPFMHSESKLIHKEAVRLYTELGIQSNLNFELRHKAIVDQFGRYPHRNDILGRKSTPEEIDFLNTPGSSF